MGDRDLYKFVKYNNIYRDVWDAYAGQHDSFFARIVWKEILEDSFRYESMYYLIMDEEGKLAGILPLLAGRDIFFRKVAVSLPFIDYVDICCEKDDIIETAGDWLRKTAGENDLHYIELRLLDHRAGILNVMPDESNRSFMMDLKGHAAERISGKIYDSDGIFRASFDRERLNDFYRIYSRAQKQKGAPAPGIDFFRRVMQRLPDNTHILLVDDAGKKSSSGALFFFSYKDRLYCRWESVLPANDGGSDKIREFIYREMIRYGLKNGFKLLDLGRTQPGSDSYHIKKRLGAEETALQYCFFGRGRHSAQEHRKKLLSFAEIWKRLPGFITDPVGKTVIKRLML